MNDVVGDPRHAGPGGDGLPERHKRLLVYALAASVALHVVLATLLPGFRPTLNPPRPLDVLLIPPPLPPPPPVPDKAELREKPAAPPPKTRQHRRPAEPVAKSRPAPLPDRQVLALPAPQSQAPPPSTFSMPQTGAEPAPAEVGEKAPVSSAPAPTRRENVATTLPSFDAAYLRNAPPRYPLIARRNGVEGTVRLKVLVTRDGRAAEVQVDQGSGSPALDNAAREAVRNWRFVPARKGVEPIESWVLVPVIFRLENAT